MPLFPPDFDGALLRHQLYILALTHFQAVYRNYFERPELHKLHNRSGELWSPLVAFIILGVTYLLAAFIRLDVVSPRSAIMWYVAGALFFTIGSSFYQGMNEFRLNIGQVMYLSVLDGLDSNAGNLSSPSQVTSPDLELGALCDELDVYLPGAIGTGTDAVGAVKSDGWWRCRQCAGGCRSADTN